MTSPLRNSLPSYPAMHTRSLLFLKKGYILQPFTMKVTVFPSARLSDTWLKKMSFGSTRVPDPLFPMAEHSLEGKFRRLRIRHRGEFAVSVRKAFWGRGIGKHLAEFAIAEAKERGISILSTSVRNDNERAIDFLLRNGFEDAGPDPMLYSIDGEFIDGKRYFRKI